MNHSRSAWSAATIAALGLLLSAGVGAQGKANDLDQFMAQVLARRDDNWKKLQQYVLDERETADFLGPGRARLFGLNREYTWYIRDGVFVRSPVRFDGVTLSEKDRRDAEQEWITSHREKEKEKEKEKAAATASAGSPQTASTSASDAGAAMDTLMRATHEPDFVSAAYFLRLKFESGHYAFVGPETFEGRNVLRIEYYPSRLYNDDHDDHEAAPADATASPDAKPPADSRPPSDEDARIERQMNKVALVTLWVEPTEHQIVQYRLDNMPMSFLPGKSLIRVSGFGATMTMSQPFPGVWLPHGIDASGSFTLANGSFDAHYSVAYMNYRLAEVKARIQ